MEKLSNTPLLEKETIIQAAYAEKKGRESFGKNPFTCYIKINSPRPNLANLTASLIEELMIKKSEAFIWAKEWDKSIVSISPAQEIGCELLGVEDPRGKLFVPVSTTQTIELGDLVANLPGGEMGIIGINNQPMTIDAFLIVYFHMVNELIWDVAMTDPGSAQVNAKSYGRALDLVASKGFSVGLLSEEEMVKAKKGDPQTSMRIYGSKVNKFVPQVMGIIINK